MLSNCSFVQVLDCFLNPFYNVTPGLVPISPPTHRFSFLGKRLELTERSPLPICVAKDYRDHARFSPFVLL